MTARTGRLSVGPRLFATVGLTAAVGGAVGTTVVRYVSPAPLIGAFGFNEGAMVGYVISGLTWASIGALLVVRRPMNAVGWLMVLVGVGYALSQLSVAATFAFAAEGTARGDRLAQLAGWVTVLLQLVAVLQVAIGFIFPSGRAQSHGWVRFMRFFWAFAVTFSLISLTQPGPLQLIPGVQNPFGVGPDLRGGQMIAPIFTLLVAIIIVGLAISMVIRYRAAGRVERQQLKWFALALGVSTIALGITQLGSSLMDRPTDALGLTVHVLSGATVPVAIGIAILRHHLYDIDRIISRTIGYGLVSVVLGSVFIVGVLAGQALLATVVGDDSTLAVAASTLVAFALFQPVRRRVQGAVDRRFHRARYDADQAVVEFADRIRAEVDLDAITTGLRVGIRQTVAPRTVGVWLRAGRP